MTHLSDVIVVKFIDWIKDNHVNERYSFDDIIHDEELLLKYAQEAIDFNILSTYESDVEHMKGCLKKSLNDFVDTFVESNDVASLLKRYSKQFTEIDEHQYQYVNEHVFDDIYQYFTYSLKVYLSYNYLEKDDFQCTNAKVLVDSLHTYLKK